MTIYSGGVPMVKIDGGKVKRMREAKGLTQLYLAAVVDVTTDTISRWENKRYPTIKRENALKLAEALEADLAEILDGGSGQELAEGSGADGGDDNRPATEVVEEAAPVVPPRKRPLWLWLPLAAGLLAFLLWGLLRPKPMDMAAVRVVPAHVVAGVPFPVVIKVDLGEVSASFILKEMLPDHCTLADGPPAGSVFDPKTGELKWLTKAKESKVVVGYMLRSTTLKPGDIITFSGRITQRQDNGESHGTTGRQSAVVSRYHWADTDENGVIDDEEILVVYDDYNEVKGIALNMDLIEDIWFGSGYRWESDSGQFVVTP